MTAIEAALEDLRCVPERIQDCYRTPPELLAAVRWVSCEPLLGPVDLDGAGGWIAGLHPNGSDAGLDWVVVGGESGPGRRPCEVEWIADIVRQCDQAEVPVFVKQGSAFRPGQQGDLPDAIWQRKEFPHVADR